MEVTLRALTQPMLIEGKLLNAEEFIVYIARASNPSNQMNMKTASDLIAYLVKHKHWSPFEHSSMTVEIKTSRAIGTQILRHRSFSFQEFSQRYANVNDMEPVQLRYQAEHNRQSSTAHLPWEHDAHQGVRDHLESCQNLYGQLLADGVAKECARMVLPLTTQTTLYMTGSIRSWLHYLAIRCDDHVQLEHREIAEAIRDIFNSQFPNIATAIKENN